VIVAFRPLELETDEVLAFVRKHLNARPSRILEVGCGTGALALRLSALGHTVTAIDVSEEAVADARAAGVKALVADFRTLEAEPFDAILFTRSLHHIDPLEAAVVRAQRLLVPGGVLLADEFAWDEVDRATAAWLYDAQALLEAGGVLRSEEAEAHRHRQHHHPGEPPADPLERWQHGHGHEPPLHFGWSMVKAISTRFAVASAEPGPYLYRYLFGIVDDERGRAVFTAMRELEVLRIAQGLLKPAGLRIVARRKAT
jgi:SAM-dependent methyltransferase